MAENRDYGSVLRLPDKAGTVIKEKEGAEPIALETVEIGDWAEKSLPVWIPADVILDIYEVDGVISSNMGNV